MISQFPHVSDKDQQQQKKDKKTKTKQKKILKRTRIRLTCVAENKDLLLMMKVV